MRAKESEGAFIIQPRHVRIWGELWHATAFTLTGSGAALYTYLIFSGFGKGQGYSVAEVLAVGLVCLGALVIFALELTYRSVFLKYFFANIGQSWISRGVVALFIFVISSVIHLFLNSSSPGMEGLSNVVAIIAVLAALFVIIYPSLVLSNTAVPYWKSSLLPLEFLVSSGVGGLAIVALLQAIRDIEISLGPVPAALGVLLVINYLLHRFHLGRVADSTKEETIKLLTQGELRAWFLVGFITLGIGIPAVLVIVSYIFESPSRQVAILVMGILALIGAFNQRYSLLRAGIKPALL